VPPDRPVVLAISGITGRMGRLVAERARAATDLLLAGGIARRGLAAEAAQAYGCDRIDSAAAAGSLLSGADVVIDFSSPEALAALLAAQPDALAGRALVVGTTGLDADIETLLARAAERGPVLVAANFSIGVNLLLSLVEAAARALDPASWDLEIVEAHHGRKADAPSGTALALGAAAASARGVALDGLRRDGRSGRTGERPAGEIGFHAVRGGGVIGVHRVLFLGGMERVELAHEALDRALFAEGALRAARWLAGRAPGRYTMRDVLGL
jgi:4-hydroxy-tetrahydrodipicolinate reductase